MDLESQVSTSFKDDQTTFGHDANLTSPSTPINDGDYCDCVHIMFLPFKDPSRPGHSPSPVFEPIEKFLTDSCSIKLGRQVRGEEITSDVADGVISTSNYSTFYSAQDAIKNRDCIWFKSKVVSRKHAEMWLKDGQLYLKDTGSSSGTFLNRMRLSPSNKGSRPYPIRDGDILQLGIDYQGRPEDVYKSIIMKVAIVSNGSLLSMRKRENPARFRAALRTLVTTTNPYSTAVDDSKTSTAASVDCCICLCGIGPYQALFLSPCSHIFHYKCIKGPLSEGFMFSCPMCRQVVNLDASVSMESLCELMDDHLDGGAGKKLDISDSSSQIDDMDEVETGGRVDELFQSQRRNKESASPADMMMEADVSPTSASTPHASNLADDFTQPSP